jgi:regulator of replication initiation timing
MDYNEFVGKVGWDVSREDYENIIEPLYVKAPSDIVGIGVSRFCKWVKENDFTMGQLRHIAAIAEAYDSAVSKVDELQEKIRELKAEVTVLGLHEQKMQERLNAVIEVADEESLVERMVNDIPTEQIIDAWVHAKILKQNSRQVRQ